MNKNALIKSLDVIIETLEKLDQTARYSPVAIEEIAEITTGLHYKDKVFSWINYHESMTVAEWKSAAKKWRAFFIREL